FGVLKRRFRVMKTIPEYAIQIQARIPAALAAIHNFIRLRDPADALFQFTQAEEISLGSSRNDVHPTVPDSHYHFHISPAEKTRASAMRDRIAQECWEQYQLYLSMHGEQNEEEV
ncbi:hypothetical protein FB446DRAFT_656232, partial [Lentinula raphanica]